MPTESELRDMLSSADAPVTLDAARIIRKSRARRLPAQIAVGGVLTLAVAGIGFAGISGILGATQQSAVMLESADDSGGGADSPMSEQEIGLAPLEKLNPCEGQLVAPTADPAGLELTTAFPAEASASEPEVPGTATLTNNGSERITGTTSASPVITVSRDGVVVWHSNGVATMQAVLVDLDPGESLDYPVSFPPVRCSAEDELGESFRSGLPALEPGLYQVSAAIEIVSDDLDSVTESAPLSGQVIGRPSAIELH